MRDRKRRQCARARPVEIETCGWKRRVWEEERGGEEKRERIREWETIAGGGPGKGACVHARAFNVYVDYYKWAKRGKSERQRD